jgi:hypothetical protein
MADDMTLKESAVKLAAFHTLEKTGEDSSDYAERG